MGIVTIYDREQQAQQERAKRAANIEKLNEQIKECDDLIAVIPNSEFADLNFIRSRRGWLYSMLEDEQRAYKNAYASTVERANV